MIVKKTQVRLDELHVLHAQLLDKITLTDEKLGSALFAGNQVLIDGLSDEMRALDRHLTGTERAIETGEKQLALEIERAQKNPAKNKIISRNCNMFTKQARLVHEQIGALLKSQKRMMEIAILINQKSSQQIIIPQEINKKILAAVITELKVAAFDVEALSRPLGETRLDVIYHGLNQRARLPEYPLENK